MLAALGVGALSVGEPLLSPATSAPATRFTEGQFINLALGARGLPWPLHTELLGHPTGAEVAPLLWPALPLAWAVGPTVALNLVFALLPAANAAMGWVAARWLGAERWGAFLTGALCAFSPWVHNTLANGQLEQVPLGGAALVWAGCVRAWTGGRAALPGLLTLGVGLAAPHVGLAALVGVATLAGLAVALPGLLPAARAREAPGRAARLRAVALPLLGVGIAAAVVHAYHSGQFGDGVHVFAPKGAVTTATAGPELPGVFEVATLGRLFWPPDPPAPQAQGVAHCAWLGWVPLVAAVGTRRPVWLALAAVFAVAALGEEVTVAGVTVPLPAAWYGSLSVALSRSANPYRLVLGAVAALALAAAFAARGPRAAVILAAAAWLEVGITRTRGIPLAAQEWVAEDAARALAGGSGAVLDVPLATPACPDVGWHYARQAMEHGRPVPVLLRFDWRAWGTLEPLGKRLAKTLSSPGCAERLPALLGEGGFTAVVWHDHRCPGDPRARACLEEALGAPSEGAGVAWWSVGGAR